MEKLFQNPSWHIPTPHESPPLGLGSDPPFPEAHSTGPLWRAVRVLSLEETARVERPPGLRKTEVEEEGRVAGPPHHHQENHRASQHAVYAALLRKVGLIFPGDGVQGCRRSPCSELGPRPLLKGNQAQEGVTLARNRPAQLTYLNVLIVGAVPAVGQGGIFPLPVLQKQHRPQSHEQTEEDSAAMVKEPPSLEGKRGRRGFPVFPRTGPVLELTIFPHRLTVVPQTHRRRFCSAVKRST